MTTPCPSCGKPVSIADAECGACGHPADTTSPMLPFSRPDGAGGIMDQGTAAYLRSKAGKPAARDLADLFTRVTRVELRRLVAVERRTESRKQLEVSERRDIQQLGACLAIDEDDDIGHLMTWGHWIFDCFDREQKVAELAIVAHGFLRWTGRWRDDARLVSSGAMADFLAERGVDDLRIEIERQRRKDHEQATRRAVWDLTWKPAIPLGLEPMIDDLTLPSAVPLSHPGHVLLARQFPDVTERILALLAWLGHGDGAWNGYPLEERAPENLLAAFSAMDIVKALDSAALTPRHLEGAARFAARWVPQAERKAHKKLLRSLALHPIRERLYAHVSGQPMKLVSLQNALRAAD